MASFGGAGTARRSGADSGTAWYGWVFNMVFKWKNGTPESYAKFDAQIVGEHLQKLWDANGAAKHLSPEAILRDAKNVESPLNSLFEWNDSVAAARYRSKQASDISDGLLVVRVTDKFHKVERTPEFFKVSVQEQAPRSYEVFDRSKLAHHEDGHHKDHGPRIPGDSDITTALTELKSWHDKYSGMKLLSELCSAIRVQWPDCKVHVPKSQLQIKLSLTQPNKTSGVVGEFCAVCLQDQSRVAASQVISGVPLCKGCVITYADEPEVLRDAKEFLRSQQEDTVEVED